MSWQPALDITDLKHMQEQLRKTERIAELGTLASGMAHEIGTPMNVILGRAEYLLQRTADEGMKKGLATIVTQIERITKVMNQLLAFARRRTPERRAVDLGEIVDDSLEMFQERIAQSRITVDKTIEADHCLLSVPTGTSSSKCSINLVMNSLHAMPDGGRLGLSLAREGASSVWACPIPAMGCRKRFARRSSSHFSRRKILGREPV